MSWSRPAIWSGPAFVVGVAVGIVAAAAGKPGLLADAEPEDGDGARLRAADRFQVDPGWARGREADAVAEQHRKYVHQDLVDETPPQALAGHVGAEDLQVLAACSVQ